MGKIILFVCFVLLYGLFGFEPALIVILSFLALGSDKNE